MGDVGCGELIAIGMIAVLVYGKELPQAARRLASLYSKVRRGWGDFKDEVARHLPRGE